MWTDGRANAFRGIVGRSSLGAKPPPRAFSGCAAARSWLPLIVCTSLSPPAPSRRHIASPVRRFAVRAQQPHRHTGSTAGPDTLNSLARRHSANGRSLALPELTALAPAQRTLVVVQLAYTN